MYWGAKTGQAYASFLHMCVVCSRRTCSSLGPPPPLMTRTQETESGLCHRPRERARLHQRLIIWLSNQSSRLASLARPKLWYVGAPVKTKKNVISDAAMMMTGAPTCTHTHTQSQTSTFDHDLAHVSHNPWPASSICGGRGATYGSCPSDFGRGSRVAGTRALRSREQVKFG